MNILNTKMLVSFQIRTIVVNCDSIKKSFGHLTIKINNVFYVKLHENTHRHLNDKYSFVNNPVEQVKIIPKPPFTSPYTSDVSLM